MTTRTLRRSRGTEWASYVPLEAARRRGGRTSAGDKIAAQVDGRSLALTNLAKVLYPVDGFTKAEVLDYYQRISPVLVPHIAGRPMTLRRFPHGVGDLSLFEKHAPAHRPDWLRTEEVVSRSSRSRTPARPSATSSSTTCPR